MSLHLRCVYISGGFLFGTYHGVAGNLHDRIKGEGPLRDGLFGAAAGAFVDIYHGKLSHSRMQKSIQSKLNHVTQLWILVSFNVQESE